MVIARARLSSTTMPVAADRPPIMVISATPRAPAASGSASTVRSRLIAAVRKHLEPGDRERRDEQVDQHEIGRKQPGGGSHAALIVVLDHRDVKLARQQDDGERRKQRGDAPERRVGPRLDDRGDLGFDWAAWVRSTSRRSAPIRRMRRPRETPRA